MRRINFIILIFPITLISIPFTLIAQGYYEPEELSNIVTDFSLSYNILDEDGVPIQGALDGIATIRILQKDDFPNEIYTLSFYLDKTCVAKKNGISLPYDFKWNFKGLSDGDHELSFLLEDPYGKVGIVRFDTTVQH